MKKLNDMKRLFNVERLVLSLCMAFVLFLVVDVCDYLRAQMYYCTYEQKTESNGKVFGMREYEQMGSPSHLVIPDGYIAVGKFWKVYNLQSVKMPNSVRVIEHAGFYGCSNLSDVKLSESLLAIGNMAFTSCLSLNRIRIPPSVRIFDGDLFNDVRGGDEYGRTTAEISIFRPRLFWRAMDNIMLFKSGGPSFYIPDLSPLILIMALWLLSYILLLPYSSAGSKFYNEFKYAIFKAIGVVKRLSRYALYLFLFVVAAIIALCMCTGFNLLPVMITFFFFAACYVPILIARALLIMVSLTIFFMVRRIFWPLQQGES